MFGTAGLATAFGVTYSAEDACRGIGIPIGDSETTITAARGRLEKFGVNFIRSDAVEGA